MGSPSPSNSSWSRSLIFQPVHLVIIILTLQTSLHLSYTQAQSIDNIVGSPCFTDGSCTNSKMTCFGWKCICRHELIYDEIQQQCVKTVGGKCRFPDGHGIDGILVQNHAAAVVVADDDKDTDPDIPCASNAHCNPVTNTCICNEPDYTTSSNGVCYLNYGRNCSRTKSHLLCNPNKYLKCDLQSETCGCVGFGQVYDEVQDSCVAKSGSYCDLKQYMSMTKLKCVQNAHCSKAEGYSDPKDEDYMMGKCYCNSGFIKVGDYCMPLYWNKCVVDLGKKFAFTCAPNQNLICQQSSDRDSESTSYSQESFGRCICAPGSTLYHLDEQDLSESDQSEYDEIYDDDDSQYESSSQSLEIESAATCIRILLHGEFCTFKDICTANSHCVEDKNSQYYYNYHAKRALTSCQCLQGFSATPEGTCKSSHQQPCHVVAAALHREDSKVIHKDVKDKETLLSSECNEYLGLECHNGKCQCSISKSSEFNGTHCVLLEGETCTSQNVNIGKDEGNPDLLLSLAEFCTKDAHCNLKTRKCECNHSFRSLMGKCYPAFPGARCDDNDTETKGSSSNPCLEGTGLQCHNNICTCINATITSTSTRKIRHDRKRRKGAADDNEDEDNEFGTEKDLTENLVYSVAEFDWDTGKCVVQTERKHHLHHKKSSFTSKGHTSKMTAVESCIYFMVSRLLLMTIVLISY